MNAIAPVNQQTTKSVIQWSEQSLPDKLSALLDEGLSLKHMPVIGPKTAGQLREYIAQPEPPLVSEGQVENMIGKLSMALPKAQVSDAEAKERLAIYWQALKHHALADLHQAFAILLRKCRFFPTIAEIEEVVNPIRYKRIGRMAQARLLVLKHEHEWSPPLDESDRADPVEVKALLSNLRAGPLPEGQA